MQINKLTKFNNNIQFVYKRSENKTQIYTENIMLNKIKYNCSYLFIKFYYIFYFNNYYNY